MRLISLGSRAVAALAAACATAAVVLTAAATPVLAAPVWNKIAVSDTQAEWSVDQGSIRRDGDFVLSSVKITQPSSVASAINGKWMDYQIQERADDCKGGRSAVLSRTDYTRSGERVAQGVRYTTTAAQFAPPGSDPIARALADYVCSHVPAVAPPAPAPAGPATPSAPIPYSATTASPPPPPLVVKTAPPKDRVEYQGPPVVAPAPTPAPAPAPKAPTPPTDLRTGANLTPSIDTKGKSEADWTFLSRNEKGDLTVAVLDGSTQTTPDGVSVVTRSDYGADEKLDDGTAYRRDVSRILIDCENRRFGYQSSDYYDVQGRLVGVETAPKSGVEKDKIPPGSLVERLANLVCHKDAAPKSQEMSIYTGTGFLTAKGYIVTASHVVGGAKTVTIYRDGKRLGEADVARDDPANDVVILKPKFDTSQYAALRLKTGPAVLGSRVFTLGYPLADELGYQTVKMAAGDVSSLTGVDYASHRIDDPRFLQISIPVQGGNSGGPVIDEDGEVIAIISSKKERTADSELTQNVNFALKSSYVTRLLVDLPVAGRYRLSTAHGKISTIIADVQSGVFLVWVERPTE